MIYNMAIPAEAKKANDYFGNIRRKKGMVRITKVSPKRTYRQNNYLHLIIGAFGVHFGYDAEESKLMYKYINSDTYIYKKKGRTFIRSSADLSKEEMAKTIDKFRQASAEQGYDLPLATDQDWLRQIENEIERSKYYY